MKYECHITIDPLPSEALVYLEYMAKRYGFKVARLLMDKGVPNDSDQFMTWHDNHYASMVERMGGLCRWLKENGCVIRRYKIEEILLDSRVGDTEQLL